MTRAEKGVKVKVETGLSCDTALLHSAMSHAVPVDDLSLFWAVNSLNGVALPCC